MSEKGKIKIQRQNITGTPPANALAVKMTVDNFLAALKIKRDGDTVTLYLDSSIAHEITGPGNDPIRLELSVEYPERTPPPPSPAKAESCQKPSESQSKETHKKPEPTPASTGRALW